MKKLLLMTAVLMMTASAMAQDIFLGANQTNNNGKNCYSISKNGTVLYSHTSSDYNYQVEDMLALDNGDMYYLNHLYDGNTLLSNTDWTDVRIQSGSTNSLVYNCPTQQGIFLNSLAYDYDNDDIYAAGSYYDSNRGKRFAYTTKNDELFSKIEDYSYYSNQYGITVCNGNVWTCGGETWNSSYTDESYLYMMVWKNGEYFADAYDLGNYSIGYDIAVYNDVIYVCGEYTEGGVSKGALWKITWASTNIEENDPTVTLLGKLEGSSNNNARLRKLDLEGGNIYMSYVLVGEETGVWKYNLRNGTFTKYCTFSANSASTGNIDANSHGVYTTANDNSKYWLNGNSVTTSVSGSIHKIAVACTMQYPVIELSSSNQFYDAFSTGDTYWDEWIKYDYDIDNGNYVSYWDRIDYSGNELYAAWHRWGCNTDQGGDLATPAIKIPSNANAKLGFYSKIWDLSSYAEGGNSVYIIESDETITPEDYTEFGQHRIWDMDEMIDNGEITQDSWKYVTIDLSEYKGETIHVVFYYIGECAHAWVVDDVKVWIESFDDVNETYTSYLSVMPNPAQDVIYISGLKNNEEVRIYNTLGQVVKTARLSDGQSLSVSDLSAGVYVLRSENSAKAVKFTVQ